MKQDLGFYLKRISETLEKLNAVELRENGLTKTQSRVLDFLESRPGKTATQRDMEIFFAVSHPTVTGIVKRMEARGLVSTETKDRGRSSKKVSLTEKGEEMRKQNEKCLSAHRKSLLAGFSKTETAGIEAALKRMYGNLCGNEEGGEGTSGSAAKPAAKGKGTKKPSAR